MARYVNPLTAAEIISEYTNIPLHELVDIMVEVPSEDVAPVRHGHWIPRFVSKRGLSDHFVCSECAESSFTYHKVKMIKYDHCPNCGAKMDGGSYA
ncbi:MAG: hypothetical protein ACI4JK_05330 [Oscillospiraceae bacterium]